MLRHSPPGAAWPRPMPSEAQAARRKARDEREAEAAAADEPAAAGEDGEDEQAQGEADPEIFFAQPEKRIRDYFRWRPLPWWIAYLLGIFLLTKLQIVYNDSPCAVLGTQSPVSMSDVKKAFRTLSLCTHPDRLRGRLKRTPTAAEERRGEIIFNRASGAKDELQNILKGKKKVACYQGELELALLTFLQQAASSVGGLGIGDYAAMGMDLFWNIVTFEAGILNTLLSLLWMAFLFRIGKQFFMYLWRMGIVRGVVAVGTAVVIGPIPTLVHFFSLPFIRLFLFVKGIIKDFRPDVDVQEMSPSNNGEETDPQSPKKDKEAPELTAAMRAAAKKTEELPKGLIQRKKKKESEEEKKERNEALLAGGAAAPAEVATPIEVVQPGGPMPDGIWNCLALRCREPLKARQNAANAVQFDLLLILTKPIIPLFMLIALGQVWNGLFSSLFIGHALRKWVPQMSYEAHHLLCMFFGTVHTLLGVSAQQVEEYANREGKKVLSLVWTWSFKDVLCVMHMCLLGPTVTAMSSMGNEPSYASSFAAGIALRIALAQDSIRGLGPFQMVAERLEASLKDLGISLVASEEVVAYSGDGIGDCGGGPFRMLFGDGAGATWAARIVKVWLMAMPLLGTCMWILRTIQAGKMLGKRRKTTRFVQRMILAILGLLQCILLANVELNASNGVLGNFWMAMLLGCVGESLLCTYDVRGPVRQIVFLLLFLLI